MTVAQRPNDCSIRLNLILLINLVLLLVVRLVTLERSKSKSLKSFQLPMRNLAKKARDVAQGRHVRSAFGAGLWAREMPTLEGIACSGLDSCGIEVSVGLCKELIESHQSTGRGVLELKSTKSTKVKFSNIGVGVLRIVFISMLCKRPDAAPIAARVSWRS